jgi:hypothetical protein
MAVRQQQRRGTASQWVSANPILAAGEIGFEVDTNKFKIGDGTNRWEDLVYFTADAAAAIQDLIDGAPDLLDTLNELAASIGDNPDFIGTMTTNLAAKAPIASPTFTGTVSGVTKSMVGLGSVDNTADSAKPVSTAQATAISTAKSEAISTASSDATTKANNAKSGAETTAATALASHESDTTNIHGIADTSALATKTYADNAASTAVAAVVNSAPEALNTLKELADALTADESTAATLATLVGTKASSADLASHEADTTNIHGIANTAQLATKTYADSAVSTAVSGLTKSSVGLSNVDNTSDANKPVSTATQTALDAKLASATAASTYAPIVSPTFTGTVSGITKSMVGLGSVDNTADSAKPVSTSTQTALDLKADLASPALTGTPSAPTASFSTDSTQIATTAFVKSVLNNIGSLNLVLDGGGVSQ